MTGPPAGASAHAVVDDVATPALDHDEDHHLRRVLRLRPGDRLTVTDGAGSWRWCRLGGAALEPDGDVESVARPAPALTVAFALTKGAKPELVVQKLTELGIDRIVPFRAARSVVRWDRAKAQAQHRRWADIARAAVSQSRSCWLPAVDLLTDLEQVATLRALRADRDGDPPSLARPVVAVGPEGGWDDAERRRLPEAVSLGANVLRAESAAITAGVVLGSLRSGLVAETGQKSTERGKRY